MIEQARALLKLGLSVIPVPHRQKGPILPNWQHVRVTEANLDKYFSNKKPSNVGVLLGEPSGGIVDIDLDCPEALELAPQFLPAGARCFGRSSKRKSHWIYRISENLPSKPFADPDTEEMLLEFRSTGVQTVFPGSVHATGETIEWESQDEFVTVDGKALLDAAKQMANAILISRGKPPRDWDSVAVCEPEPSMPPADLPSLNKRKARARSFIAKVPPAISGKGGHRETFYVASLIRRGFYIPDEDGLELMREYNTRCQPPWSEKELRYKLDSAARCGKMKWFSKLELKLVQPSTDETPNAPQADWMKGLTHKSESELAGTARNATAFLINHEAWRGSLAYDEFHDKTYWTRSPPEIPGQPIIQPSDVHDDHATYIQQWFWLNGIKLEKHAAQDAISPAARAQTVNPLRDYITSIEWDRIPRLSRWLATYLGVKDNEYSRKVGEWFMVGAAERALTPGSQMDYMLVFEGPQGGRKSTAIRILGGDFYRQGIPDTFDKDAADALCGHHIIELDELESFFRRVSYSKFKQWISKREDMFRPAYGRTKIRRLRTCAFIGSTNEFEYLPDPTGARRIWPVRVGKIDTDGLARDRDQLWAEALHLHTSGARRHPTDTEILMVIREQDARFQVDPWEERILKWVSDKEFVTADDILSNCICLAPGQMSQRERVRVCNCLRRGGWEDERRRVGELHIRGFKAPCRGS